MDKADIKNNRTYASEIGQYHFCSLAWYLQKKGYKSKSSSLKRGVEKHQIYGKKLSNLKKHKYFVKILYVGGILCLFIAIILYIFEGYI
jgi:hypothetical protein